MTGPATISELQLLAATRNQGWYGDFAILACPTGLDLLTPSFAANYDGNTPSTVLAFDTLELRVEYDRWIRFVFDTLFGYSGEDNLLLEFRWEGDDGGTIYTRGWYPPGGSRGMAAGRWDTLAIPGDLMSRMRLCFATGTAEPEPAPAPRARLRCRPSLFRDRTTVSLPVDRPLSGAVRVVDASGRTVRALAAGRLPAGPRELTWDRTDDAGGRVPPGSYFVILDTGTTAASAPLLVLD